MMPSSPPQDEPNLKLYFQVHFSSVTMTGTRRSSNVTRTWATGPVLSDITKVRADPRCRHILDAIAILAVLAILAF